MKKLLRSAIQTIENAPISLATFSLSFLALILTRLAIEGGVGLYQPHGFTYLFFEFTHTFLFFICAFMLFIPLVRFAGGEDLKKSANFLLFGFLLILTPPIVDKLIFRNEAFWSFYEFDGLLGLLHRYFTLFGDTPHIGITYGVRLEVILVTLALGIYTYAKRSDILRSLLVMVLSYTLLFVLGTLPSWLTFGILLFEKSPLLVTNLDVASIFLTPETILGREIEDLRIVLNIKMSLFFGFFAILLSGFHLYHASKEHFFAILRNARIPQLIYHAGLVSLGMLLAFVYVGVPPLDSPFPFLAYALLVAAAGCAWIASVIVNDLIDIEIDRVTNKHRPLIEKTISEKEYVVYGTLFFFASIILSGLVSPSALILLLCYQAIAFLYSAPPLRLKRFPGLATLLAAGAGLLVLCLGFLAVAPSEGIRAIPASLLFFLLGAYALSLPIKDFKDIEGDKKDGVYTIPVLLGADNAKWVIGSLFFLLYGASPIILHEPGLFLPALFFGSLSFWVIQRSNGDEASFFAFRKLAGLLLALIIAYGLSTLLFFL